MKDTKPKTPAYYKEGIAAYAEHQKIIIEVITQHNNKLHQKMFDKEFADREWPIVFYADSTFVLGEILDLRGWSMWLDLLQTMILAELVAQKGKLPNVCYFLPTRVQ